MRHLFSDELDLYALISSTSVERICSLIRAREQIRKIAEEWALDEAHVAPTEAPSSDTMPVSYVAPTSRPAHFAEASYE